MTSGGARLAVLGVFLAGAVSGAAALHLYRLRVENRIFHAPDPVAQLVVYKLDQDLSLTPAQREEVRAAIHAARNEILGMKQELMPLVVAAFERASDRIDRTLTPEQRPKFHVLVEERRRVFQAVLPPRAPSPAATPAPATPPGATPPPAIASPTAGVPAEAPR